MIVPSLSVTEDLVETKPLIGLNPLDILDDQSRPALFSCSGWITELGTMILSLLSMLSLIIMLSQVDGRPQDDWKWLVQPTTCVAIFSTLARVALLLPLAECISQMKWLYLQEGCRSLIDIDQFDGASRGPFGAIRYLCLINRRSWSGSIGAILTILSVFMGSFSQQLLSFETQITEIDQQTATINVANVYDNGQGFDSFGQPSGESFNADRFIFQH